MTFKTESVAIGNIFQKASFIRGFLGSDDCMLVGRVAIDHRDATVTKYELYKTLQELFTMQKKV